MKTPIEMLNAIIKMQEKNYGDGIQTHLDLSDMVEEAKAVVKNCSIPLVMPCTSFEHTAVYLKDGSTAVWTDGLSLNSDNDRHCHYKLEEGQKYKVVVYKA